MKGTKQERRASPKALSPCGQGKETMYGRLEKLGLKQSCMSKNRDSRSNGKGHDLKYVQ